MDRELRDLERQAAQGDTRAQYRLLIRKATIDDFEMTDLSEEARINMARELLRSLSQQAGADVYIESDSTFVPNYTSTTECPRHSGGCEGQPDDFTYHVLVWQRLSVEEREGELYAHHSSVSEDEMGSTLYCPSCKTSWIASSADIEWL